MGGAGHRRVGPRGRNFAFDSTATRTSGTCLESFPTILGYDASGAELHFYFYSGELGPFPAELVPGSRFDKLYFEGPSVNGYTYSGLLYLY